jgi:hypothetical protein
MSGLAAFFVDSGLAAPEGFGHFVGQTASNFLTSVHTLGPLIPIYAQA